MENVFLNSLTEQEYAELLNNRENINKFDLTGIRSEEFDVLYE
jgi:hypothetical protein